jgi:MFS family permease
LLDQLRPKSARNAARPRLVGPLFLLIMLSTFAYFVSVGALVPTLPLYVEGPLGGGDVAVGLAIGVFSLAAVLFRPLVGRVSDERGRRVLMIAGGSIVGVSVLAYMVADSFTVLLPLRFISGLGEAAFYVGAASVINDLAPDERRGEALSYFSLALFGGLGVGPVIGEWVLGPAGFEGAWVVAGVAALLAAVLGLRVPDTRPEVTGQPPPRRLVHPAGLVPGVVLASNIWGLAGFTTFVPLYALDIGLSGSRLVFALYSVIVLLVRSVGARIPDRFGARRSVRVALCTTALGFVVMAMWADPVGLYLGASLFALGHSLVFPALMTLAIGSAPASERGAVVGTFTAFFDLAFGLGAVTLGGVAALVGYRGLFLTAAVIAIGGLSVLLYHTSHKRVTQAAPTSS